MAQGILESGRVISNTEKELKYGKMVGVMKESM
jgi:hypothetical protein